ncbi:MAG: M48 family metalloprotease [Deltaproteobacteria bacterium]|nr:M48 family metalloprotease [Deltaproteobacteria bacterium]
MTGQHELMLLSEPDEIRLGRKTDAQIAQTYGIYDDPDLMAYIEGLGQRIAGGSHRPHLSFEFKILDSPVVNAFAVPGGYIYVSRGILSYLNSEAELAGVIGHEIGHVAARHSAQQYSRAQLAQLGLGLGVILSEDFRQYVGLAQFGVGMLFLRFSRDNERQADQLGVEYATKAGFDASRMAAFFSTLERLHPSSDKSGLPGWFSTHPNPPDRIRAVQRKSREWTSRLDARELQVNRNAYLRRIEGLVFGEDPRQGYVADQVFYHPGLRFQFPVPSDWKLNNSPAQVQMVSKTKNAAILFSVGKGSSPAAAREFVAKADARVIKFDSTRVNGLPAQQVISDISSQQGTTRVMSWFISKEERVFVFHGFTSQAMFERYGSAFRVTMGGFATLTDPKRINVRPDRIRIRATGSAGTLKEAFRSLGMPDNKLKEMALLNGRHLGDWIAAHSLLKVVEKGQEDQS